MNQRKYSVNYNKLKINISKSCRAKRNGNKEFMINYDKLSELSANMGLTLVNTGLKSRPIHAFDIGFISEYLKGEKLTWVDCNKDYTVLTFIRSSAIDSDCKDLLSLIEGYERENIDCTGIDKVKLVGKLIAKYPCVNCLVVSYKTNDPDKIGRLYYNITCRSNTILIREQLAENYGPDKNNGEATKDETMIDDDNFTYDPDKNYNEDDSDNATKDESMIADDAFGVYPNKNGRIYPNVNGDIKPPTGTINIPKMPSRLDREYYDDTIIDESYDE